LASWDRRASSIGSRLPKFWLHWRGASRFQFPPFFGFDFILSIIDVDVDVKACGEDDDVDVDVDACGENVDNEEDVSMIVEVALLS